MTEKFYSKNTDRISFSVLRFSMILLKILLKVLDWILSAALILFFGVTEIDTLVKFFSWKAMDLRFSRIFCWPLKCNYLG